MNRKGSFSSLLDSLSILWPSSLLVAGVASTVGLRLLATVALATTLFLMPLGIRRITAGLSISLAINFWVVGSLGGLGSVGALALVTVLVAALWLVAAFRGQGRSRIAGGKSVWLTGATVLMLLGIIKLDPDSIAGTLGKLPLAWYGAVLIGAAIILGLPVSRVAVLFGLEATGAIVAITKIGLLPESIYGFAVNEIWLARCSALGAMAAFTLARRHRIHSLAGVFLLAVTLWQGKEGPILALVVGIACLLWQLGRTRLTLVLIAAGLPLIPLLRGLGDENATSRYDAWSAALTELNGVTGIVGSGFEAVPQGLNLEYAHNAVLEVWLALGLVGLLSLAAIVVSTSITGRNSPFLPLFVTGFAFALVSGTISSNPEYWILSALVLADPSLDAPPGRSSETAPPPVAQVAI